MFGSSNFCVLNVWFDECLVNWIFGLLNVWFVECLVFWMFGLLNVWFVESLVCWMFGLSNFLCVECLVCWIFGLLNSLVCWMFGSLNVWFVECLGCLFELLNVCLLNIWMMKVMLNFWSGYVRFFECLVLLNSFLCWILHITYNLTSLRWFNKHGTQLTTLEGRHLSI